MNGVGWFESLSWPFSFNRLMIVILHSPLIIFLQSEKAAICFGRILCTESLNWNSRKTLIGALATLILLNNAEIGFYLTIRTCKRFLESIVRKMNNFRESAFSPFPMFFLPFSKWMANFKSHLFCCLQMFLIWKSLRQCLLVKTEINPSIIWGILWQK